MPLFGENEKDRAARLKARVESANLWAEAGKSALAMQAAGIDWPNFGDSEGMARMTIAIHQMFLCIPRNEDQR